MCNEANKLEKQVTTYFDHNFFKSKRIDFRFCTLAKLEKLNNFYLYRIEDYPNKKSRNRDFRLYLARARARAPGPRERWGLRPLPRRDSKDFLDLRFSACFQKFFERTDRYSVTFCAKCEFARLWSFRYGWERIKMMSSKPVSSLKNEHHQRSLKPSTSKCRTDPFWNLGLKFWALPRGRGNSFKNATFQGIWRRDFERLKARFGDLKARLKFQGAV